MYDYAAALAKGKPAADAVSTDLRQQLHAFLVPLLKPLDAQIDARLVRTFQATIELLLRFRHRHYALLLSELGAELLSPDRAPAGTKRLSNLLRSRKWDASLLTDFLWEQATSRFQALLAQGQAALLVWDDSVLEKPESLRGEGLCPVRSSKATRLTRPKPGCFRKPGPPVVVPGLHWLCLLLLGESGPPTVATMRWFSLPRRPKRPKGEPHRNGGEPTDAAATAPQPEPASDPTPSTPAQAVLPIGSVADLRTLRTQLLRECLRRWGRKLLHVFDRGYAGTGWLGIVLEHGVRFVLRWPKRYQLVDTAGQKRPAWQIARGRKSWGHRWFWDVRHRAYVRVGVLAFRVRHPEYDQALWLVVSRTRGKNEPWYLLTTEPIHTEADAWKVVRAYSRRWQVELTFRYTKSELAMESPRLWKWEGRLKLLLMVTLAYAFLLQLLVRSQTELRQWLLRYYCHRTGRRARAAKAPLYRLRAALSRLWQEFPASPNAPARQNPG